MDTKTEPLHGKYVIQKSDGSPVDPEADYFVLRLDTDPAAREAAWAYANATRNAQLAEQLRQRVMARRKSQGWPCR